MITKKQWAKITELVKSLLSAYHITIKGYRVIEVVDGKIYTTYEEKGYRTVWCHPKSFRNHLTVYDILTSIKLEPRKIEEYKSLYHYVNRGRF